MVKIVAIAIAVLIAHLSVSAYAASGDMEIQHLLTTIGDSDCTFSRNGSDHTAADAEDHLRMKYRRAGKRINTAEAFINHLASKSSWTGKAYMISCNAEPPVATEIWLHTKLIEFRDIDSGG